MIARLPDMHRQLRDLAARVAQFAGPSAAEQAEPVAQPPEDPTGF